MAYRTDIDKGCFMRECSHVLGYRRYEMIDSIRQAIAEAMVGHERFYRQYDKFEVQLTRWCTGVPFIRVSVLVCTGNSGISDGGGSQAVMNAISSELASRFPETQFHWESGFSGGNSLGWDMWVSLHLGTLANRLIFGEDEILFLHRSDLHKSLVG